MLLVYVETVIMVIYKNAKAMVDIHDGDIDFLKIVVGILQKKIHKHHFYV